MRLDIVIPAHNEQHRIDAMLKAFRSRLTEPDTRFLVAMDCCTDSTAQIVGRHAALDPRVAGISYPKLGKGGVIMETLRRCDAEVVGFVDADCATPPAEFARLVEAVSAGAVSEPDRTADMAIAARWHRAAVLPGSRSISRRVESRVFAGTIRTLFGLPYRDTQCGAKVFRREVAESILPLMSSRDFLFDVELLMAARSMGFRVVEVPTVWVDRAGSRLHAGRDGRRMALSALRLWVHVKTIPLPEGPTGPEGHAATGPEPQAADWQPDLVDLAAAGRAPVGVES